MELQEAAELARAREDGLLQQEAALAAQVQQLEAELKAERQRAQDAMGKAGSDQQQLAAELQRWQAEYEAEARMRKIAEEEKAALKAEVDRLQQTLHDMEVEQQKLRCGLQATQGQGPSKDRGQFLLCVLGAIPLSPSSACAMPLATFPSQCFPRQSCRLWSWHTWWPGGTISE